MKVVRVQHVSVNCEGRLDETQAFYAEVFGLADEERPDIPGVDGHWFKLGAAGDVQLHLVDAGVGTGDVRPADAHWCVEVDDLDAALGELADRGTAHLCVGEGAGRQVWLTDPAGNIVELQQAR
jgi:catechol 2,3-dioxygenase-like lactoylglutathione lyase family enzyme